MTSSPMGQTIQHLRRAAVRRDGAGLTDAELLEAFVARRDAAAFEALVRRHGPMVLGVCRRVLRDAHGAEDAFQATFLVLVRRAASVVPREAVGNWLYGVAYRTALEARRAAARRRARERQVHDMPHPTVGPQEIGQELRPLLDEELSRLPDKYRSAVVLCDLEGRTRKEAAVQLGVPEGTVSGRLTTARRLLAQRLSRRGLTLSGAALALALSREAASASVPNALLAATVQAATLPAATGLASAQAVALAGRVNTLLALGKLKALTAFVLAVAALGGAGWVAHSFRGAERSPEVRTDSPALAPVKAVALSDREKLQGTWVAVSGEWSGVKDFDKFLSDNRLVFAGDRLTLRTTNGDWEGPFRLNPGPRPRQLDADFGGEVGMRAVYELEGDRLTFCYAKGGERPVGLASPKGQFTTFLYVFERQK